jgi:hypothetical protein
MAGDGPKAVLEFSTINYIFMSTKLEGKLKDVGVERGALTTPNCASWLAPITLAGVDS